MPENVVNLINAIKSARGEEYAEGLVDMANILAPKAKPEGGKAEEKEEA